MCVCEATSDEVRVRRRERRKGERVKKRQGEGDRERERLRKGGRETTERVLSVARVVTSSFACGCCTLWEWKTRH